MPEESEIQARIIEFERNRNQLLNVSAQKQQLQLQGQSMQDALQELEKTKEKRVYKAVGNILILADVSKVKNELKERKESTDLRIKTLQKQEDSLINRLNKLKSEIESEASVAAPPAENIVSETETGGKEHKKK